MTAPEFRFPSSDAALWRPRLVTGEARRVARVRSRVLRIKRATMKPGARERILHLVTLEQRLIRLDPSREKSRPIAHPAPASLETVEDAHIRTVVAWAGGNISRAARQLGITRPTLYARLRKLGCG